ncbi:MAG: hypothetical protein N2554_03615, partial [Fimbriimonadales bacterium]|nr:hypothetical protein [Fimbriimonadales bacterium]
VGAHRGGDAKLAEQAFDEAVSAVNEIVYPDTRAHLTQLLEMARATCRSQGEPASQQNAAHPAGKPASSEDTPPRRPLKQLLSEGDYLTAFKVAWGGDSWEELPYSVTDFVAAQLARDPRRIILLPALLKRLSDYEIFAIARALIKAGDYGTALRLTLRMRNMDYRFEVVMRTALAQAQRGQKEIALATVELLDSLILRLEPHEFKLYKYLYRMYTRWGDTEQAALCLQKMQQIAYQTEYDEIIQINKIIEILILVHDYKALDELLEQHYAGMEVVIEIAARLLDEGSIEEATPLVEWIISKIYVDRIMPCDTKTAHVLVAALKTKRQREVLRILTRHSLTHRQCRIAEAVLRRCLDQADYDTARLVALHIPYDSSGSTSGSVRQNVLALLATRLIYEGDQDSWRPLYYELVQNGEAAKEWWNLYNALVGGGWYREAALLAGSSLPSAYSPLIEAGEYDLVLYFVAPPNPLWISCTLPRPPLRHLAREITLLQGRAAAKAYLKQLDSPVSQFLWLMGIFEADYPLLPPQPLEMRY